jgi:hypothetical protein
MSSFWRQSFAVVLSLSLGLSSYAGAPQSVDPNAEKLDAIKENLDLVVPVRRGEHFDEVYYRIETRLEEYQKEEFATLNRKLKLKLSLEKMPADVKATDTSIVFKDKDKESELVLRVEKSKEGELFVTANGQKLTEEQVSSPLASYEVLKKILSTPPKSNKKGAMLFDLFFPQAQALFGLSTPVLIAGVGALAAIGIVLYKRAQDKKKSCKNKDAMCCNIAGTATQLSNGCCTEAGGFDIGYKTCPSALYIDSSQGATSTTTTTDTSATGVQ